MQEDANTVEFVLTISLNSLNEPEFNYTRDGVPVTGDFVVEQQQTISYQLTDNTNKGLKFIGAAFEKPFNKVIDDVWIQNNGQQINLLDLDKVVGKARFRFVLSNNENSLMVLSPDPQIISRG